MNKKNIRKLSIVVGTLYSISNKKRQNSSDDTCIKSIQDKTKVFSIGDSKLINNIAQQKREIVWKRKANQSIKGGSMNTMISQQLLHPDCDSEDTLYCYYCKSKNEKLTALFSKKDLEYKTLNDNPPLPSYYPKPELIDNDDNHILEVLYFKEAEQNVIKDELKILFIPKTFLKCKVCQNYIGGMEKELYVVRDIMLDSKSCNEAIGIIQPSYCIQKKKDNCYDLKLKLSEIMNKWNNKNYKIELEVTVEKKGGKEEKYVKKVSTTDTKYQEEIKDYKISKLIEFQTKLNEKGCSNLSKDVDCVIKKIELDYYSKNKKSQDFITTYQAAIKLKDDNTNCDFGEYKNLYEKLVKTKPQEPISKKSDGECPIYMKDVEKDYNVYLYNSDTAASTWNKRYEKSFIGIRYNANCIPLDLNDFMLKNNNNKLGIKNNNKLTNLGGLTSNLKELYLRNLPQINNVSKLPSNLNSLELLDLPQVKDLSELPSNLKELYLRNSPQINNVSKLPSNLKELTLYELPQVKDVSELPSNLNKLTLWDLPQVKDVSELPSNLNKLTLWNLPQVKDVSELPSNLKELSLWDLPQVKDVSELPSNLKELSLYNLPQINNVSKLPSNLNKLILYYLPQVKDVSELPSNLKELYLRNSPQINNVSKLPSNLKELTLRNLPQVKDVSELPSNLNKLTLWDLPQVKDVSELPSNLNSLDLYNLPQINNVSELPSNLNVLDLVDLHKLKTAKLSNLKKLKLLDLDSLASLERIELSESLKGKIEIKTEDKSLFAKIVYK
ncbi:hypothetical protein CPAV1605_1382 [seawater metagenome]|uniref:Leucine rich repeat n=1 Tax=seawater metagenome TaxID=1561972 RepID=A0A5E8CMJ3_9ZZZZ